MLSPQYEDLVRKLAVRTDEGKVNWKSTADESEFLVHFKDFTLSVRTGRAFDTHEDFVAFTLRDNTGRSIDNFWVDESESEYHTVLRLHAAARRKALRIDEAVTHLLQELDSNEPVGLEPPNTEGL